MTDTTPAFDVSRIADSSARGSPTASMATSTPRPPVRRLTSSRDVLADALGHAAQRQVGVGDEGELGLRALQRAERGAVPERPAAVALVVVAVAAEEAHAAGDLEAAEDPVADGHVGDAVADRDD